MNGTEQRNARMSLANDILKHSGSLMPKESNKPRPSRKETKKIKKKSSYKHKIPEHTHIPGITFRTDFGRWEAYFYDGAKTYKLGLFNTQERAFLTVKLFKLWRRRGFRTGVIPRTKQTTAFQ